MPREERTHRWTVFGVLGLFASASTGLGFSVETHGRINGGAQVCWSVAGGLLMIGIWVLARPYHAPVQAPSNNPVAPKAGPSTPSPRRVSLGVPAVPAVPSGPDFVDSYVTPEYLMGLYEGRMSVQAQALLSPFMGKKMRVSVRVGDVAIVNAAWMRISVEQGTYGSGVSMYFDTQHSLITGLKTGDLITVVGTVNRVDAASIMLDPCTLEKIG